MFEWLYYSSLADSLSKMPKEVILGALAAYVVVDYNRRNANVKVAQANARQAEAETEALKFKAQNTGPVAV